MRSGAGWRRWDSGDTAYTVWTGIGAVGAFIAGAAFLGEPLSPMRVTAAALIVAGLVLMKLSS